MSSLNSSSHHQRRESSSKTNKRGSINIWINRMRNSNHSLDDCSSLSSLSTAWVLDTSSSFYSSSTREFASDGSFDLSLLEESDDDNDDDMSSASTASSSSSESSAQQHNEPRRRQPQQQNTDWRWDSDPNLPLQRDLGSKIDTPVLPPIRSKSNAAKRRASTAARFMMQQQRKNLLTISKRTQSLKSLLQKPRMPRRQLSNASSQLLEAAQQLKKEQPMDSQEHQDVTEATTEHEHEEVTPVESPTATRRPSNAQLTFSERLRRFPMDLPTRQRQRKLPARALRIQRVTRPCPAVTEQSNTLLVVPTKER